MNAKITAPSAQRMIARLEKILPLCAPGSPGGAAVTRIRDWLRAGADMAEFEALKTQGQAASAAAREAASAAWRAANASGLPAHCRASARASGEDQALTTALLCMDAVRYGGGQWAVEGAAWDRKSAEAAGGALAAEAQGEYEILSAACAAASSATSPECVAAGEAADRAEDIREAHLAWEGAVAADIPGAMMDFVCR